MQSTENIMADANADKVNQMTATQQVGPVKAAAVGKTRVQQQKEAAEKAKIHKGSTKESVKRAVEQLLQLSEGKLLHINELLAYRVRGEGTRV